MTTLQTPLHSTKSMAGVFGSNGYGICNADSYEDAVLQCGGHEFVDDALSMVDEALNRNPHGFEKLHHASDIWVAKTKLRIKAGSVFPAMTMFFTIDDEKKLITKLWVKYSSPESMALGDPFDDFDPPF